MRDHLLGLPVKDVDIATSARPDEVEVIFGHTKFVGASFGVCLVDHDGHRFEVATFRKDGRYLDQRRPEKITFGTMEDDVRRRDFTMNALYMDPENDSVVDLVEGGTDIANRVLRAVGDPRERFKEDPLRLLRAVRFASRTGFFIEEETWQAMMQLAPMVRTVSGERVRDEITRMLMEPKPSRAFKLMDWSGLLPIVLPEISALKGIQQGRHHPEGDVFVHTMMCIDNLVRRTPVTCWAMLLHDVGKPATFERGTDGEIHFYEHEDVGAAMVTPIAARLRFSNDDMDRISTVVARHMRLHDALKWGKGAMRRFLGADTVEDDLAVHLSDCLSSSGATKTYDLVSVRYQEFLQRDERPVPQPLLTGDDLIAMGYRPGPIFKTILAAVQDRQLDGDLTDAILAREFVASEFGL